MPQIDRIATRECVSANAHATSRDGGQASGWRWRVKVRASRVLWGKGPEPLPRGTIVRTHDISRAVLVASNRVDRKDGSVVLLGWTPSRGGEYRWLL